MDEPPHSTPADDAPPSAPATTPSVAPTPLDLWLAERERGPETAIEPVLREIAAVVERLESLAAVRDDAQAQHLLRAMTLCEDMERFEALADEFARHMAQKSSPGRVRQRATRTLLKL